MKGWGRAAVAAGVVLAVGCGPSFDEDGYAQVTQWADVAVSTTQAGALTVSAYVEGDTDEAELDALREDLDGVFDQGADLPDDEEISGWLVNISQGDRSWTVEGRELAPAVERLRSDIGVLADDLDLVVSSEGEDDDVRFMAESVASASTAAEQLADVLQGQ